MLHQQPRPLSVESVLVQIEADGLKLSGLLAIPPSAIGLVVFAHGSGSSRHSPRNKLVARTLREQATCATLLVDLLSESEESVDERTLALRFGIYQAGRVSARDPHATFAMQRGGQGAAEVVRKHGTPAQMPGLPGVEMTGQESVEHGAHP